IRRKTRTKVVAAASFEVVTANGPGGVCHRAPLSQNGVTVLSPARRKSRPSDACRARCRGLLRDIRDDRAQGPDAVDESRAGATHPGLRNAMDPTALDRRQ